MNDLTDEQIAELRTKAEAATPGPWETRGYKEMRGKYVVGPRKPGDLGRGPVVLMQPLFCDERSAANADFIAAARNLVPALLDALATARTERDEARAQVQAVREIVPPDGPGCDRRATLIALKGAHSQSHAAANLLRAIRRALDGAGES